MRFLVLILFSFMISVGYGSAEAGSEPKCFAVKSAKYIEGKVKLKNASSALLQDFPAYCKIKLVRAIKATKKKITRGSKKTIKQGIELDSRKDEYDPETGKLKEKPDLCIAVAEELRKKYEEYNKLLGKAHCKWPR